MTNQDTNDWKPRQGWANNVRKFRWFNLVVPVLTPMGLVSIFLFGYITFAVIALVVAAFGWFDFARSSKIAWRRTAWKVASVALVPFAGYMIFLFINPQYGL
jgi:hypothetical protein